ncbi:MAG: SAM-dependent methyltransferase [Ktedonobacterales bacterium]|jgi:ubiquinone/menaquinone biosynthesis C-methylase UbiE/catechol 2,3-dioxygenase-like lactoylglutathione lyase family enzyme|nr:MAG: SAM-dependent methyltransferase [Ktedonobacterales bacterium]
MAEQATEILGFDHVQVAAPRDGEAQAKAFYAGMLELEEIAKPDVLAGRGGAWYRCGSQELHIGLTDDFQPQQKGHPAFRVRDLTAVRARLEAAGVPISLDVPLPGRERFETRDPFGNRLEFLQLLPNSSPENISLIPASEVIHERVRAMFSRTAEAYVASPTHAAGADLAQLLELAAPHATDLALDVSTGGGHTALALAPHVARVTASDLTPHMLATARRFITSRGATNVDYVVADAERLPFLDASFDLVTVRIAPHHYVDVARAVREMARVLTDGGRLVVIDNIAPEDPALDTLVNAWEQRRDPSHVRAYTATEWRGFIAAAGLTVSHRAYGRKTHTYATWAERAQMSSADRSALEADMLAAPEAARAHFEVTERDGKLESWTGDYLILCAEKRA